MAELVETMDLMPMRGFACLRPYKPDSLDWSLTCSCSPDPSRYIVMLAKRSGNFVESSVSTDRSSFPVTLLAGSGLQVVPRSRRHKLAGETEIQVSCELCSSVF